MKPDNLTELEYSLWSNILQIRSHKRSRIHPSTRGDYKTRIVPDHALFVADITPMYQGRETTEDIKKALNSLCRQGYLKFGKTGQDLYFEIIDNES